MPIKDMILSTLQAGSNVTSLNTTNIAPMSTITNMTPNDFSMALISTVCTLLCLLSLFLYMLAITITAILGIHYSAHKIGLVGLFPSRTSSMYRRYHIALYSDPDQDDDFWWLYTAYPITNAVFNLFSVLLDVPTDPYSRCGRQLIRDMGTKLFKEAGLTMILPLSWIYGLPLVLAMLFWLARGFVWIWDCVSVIAGKPYRTYGEWFDTELSMHSEPRAAHKCSPVDLESGGSQSCRCKTCDHESCKCKSCGCTDRNVVDVAFGHGEEGSSDTDDFVTVKACGRRNSDDGCKDNDNGCKDGDDGSKDSDDVLAGVKHGVERLVQRVSGVEHLLAVKEEQAL